MNKKLKTATTIGAFGLVFAASAATAFFVIPQNVTVIDLRDHSTPSEPVLSFREKFVNNLAEGATAGLHVEINDLKFDHYYTGENAKEGHNTITVDPENPATLDFALEELNLHGVNFALTAPVIYSNNGTDAKYRDIHASLVNDNLYLNLADRGNADSVGGERSEGGSWDFKYKISTAAYETEIDGNSEDPTTRGTYQYEYGKLDWLIADILEILSDGGISVSFEGWLDKLTGSVSVEEEEEEASTSSIDTDEILTSLNEMVNIGGEDNTAYFIWNLKLGDKSIKLGLGGNENAVLDHVDLPAKFDENGHPLENPVWHIQDGMDLSLSADIGGKLVNNGEDIDWASTIYGNPEEYRDLADSAALFRNIAKVVAKPEIGLTADLEIGHRKEAKEGSRTVMKKSSVDEAALLHLDANIDAFKVDEEGNKKRALEGIDANITIDKKREEGEEFKGHRIGVAYLEEENGYQGYLNVNDVLKAKTSKTYLDEFYTNVLKDAFSGSSEEKMDLSSITKLLGTLGDEIDRIMNSSLLKGIEDGTFVSVLDLISLIKGEDNLITIELGLSPLGLSGSVILKVSGRNDSSLLSITLKDIELASISLNGEIKTSEFEAPKEPEYGSDKEYESLSHLKGLGGQIKAIADDKSFKASLNGNLYKENGVDHALEIGGGLAFDFAKEGEGEVTTKEGKVDLSLTHFADTYVQDHNIKLGLQDDMKKIGFSYDSLSKSGKATVSQKFEKGIEGLIDLNAAKEVFSEDNGFSLDFLLDFVRGDDRFSRLGASIMGEASSSLLSDILDGRYFDLLTYRGILEDVSLGEQTKVTISGDALGLDGIKIDLVLSYDSEQTYGGDEEGNGAEKGLSDLKVLVKKDNVNKFDLTISDIDTLGEASAEAFSSFEGFTDFTPLASMGNELLNTLTMGVVENNEGNLAGVSYYGLEGSVDLMVAGYGLNVYGFTLDASVEGAETKLMADFSNLPVIRGLNGPDDAHYFRPNELEGKRDSKIYYYANGVDPDGELLLTRDSSYGRIKDVKDAVRIDGKDYNGDFLNWVLGYTLGVDESLFAKKENEEPEEPEVNNEEEAEPKKGLFDEKGIHVADCFNGFFTKDLTNGRSYTISLDLGALLGIGVIGNADLTFTSTDLHSASGFDARCLTGLEANVYADATAANDGSKLRFAEADVTIGLTNFDADGLISEVNGLGSEYANLFVKDVNDNGIIDAEAKGDLYDLVNGFQSDDKNNPYYSLYGYNYIGLDEIPAGRNLYLGIA